LDPPLAIGRYKFDDSMKLLTFESFPFKYLSDFFSLTVRREVDVPVLDVLQSLPIVMLRFGAEIITGRHRESVGKQVGEPEGQNYPR
jgi:hypothetical protein